MLGTKLKKLQFWSYRTSTVLKSFKALYTLPQEKIDAFLNSYNIYDHDWVNEDHLIEKMGADYYQEIKRKLVDYYSVLNHLCAIGQIEKMYIPPAMDLSVSIIRNQSLFEKKMCEDLGIGKESKVLDIGCGRGRVACNVASMTGADVVGINLDPSQLEYARQFAKGSGLSEQCQFQLGDLNERPFPFADQSLDGVYQIQAFTFSKNLLELFKDIYRVLKPGGKLACLDWVSLDKYDSTNPTHADFMKRIKPLIGAIGTISVERFVDLLKQAGFNVLVSENPSEGGCQAPLIENADRFFTRIARYVKVFVGCKILPKHFQALFDRLTKDGKVLIEADRMRLVTTCHYILAQKPADTL